MNSLKKIPNLDEEINLLELINVLWSKKILVLGITFAATIFSVGYSLSLPDIYMSQALLKPTKQEGSSSGALSQYSGLAGLAGISIPSTSDDKSSEAIERMNSFEFYKNFISPSFPSQDLMAIKDWDQKKNTLVYNEKFFNSNSKKWIRDVSFPKMVSPSHQESFEFYKDTIDISQDEMTKFVNISAKHPSPHLARKLVNLMIVEINKSMRNEEKYKSQKSLDFLMTQLQKTNYDELKQAIASLQESQMKALMLIESNEDYVFKIIDSPISPEQKYEPKRLQIVILGLILGFLLGSIFTLAMYFKKKNISEATI